MFCVKNLTSNEKACFSYFPLLEHSHHTITTPTAHSDLFSSQEKPLPPHCQKKMKLLQLSI